MKELDTIALTQFNPANGDYLVVRGKDDNQHLVCKRLKGANIPFFGRLLQKIIYPDFRFKKVINYLYSQENPLEGVEDANLKETFRTKVTKYFRLDENGIATRHKILWGRVHTNFENAHRKPITSFFRDGKPLLEGYCDLPYAITNQLPKDEDYIVGRTFDISRPMTGFKRFIEDLKTHLATVEKPPVILFVCFDDNNGYTSTATRWGIGRLTPEMEAAFQELKDNKAIRDYCPIYRDFPRNIRDQEPRPWDESKAKNDAAIQQLLKRLQN